MLSTLYARVADSLALEQHEVHKEFREQLTRNREEGWYATELPEIEIIHLYRLINKVVCIDYLFKCPNYAAKKSYENDVKLSIASIRRVWLSRQPTERGFYMPHRGHQGDCTVW